MSNFAEGAVTKHYRNGIMVHMYFSNGKNFTKAAETLINYCQESDSNYVPNKGAVRTSICDLMDKIKRLKKKKLTETGI